MEDHKKIAYSTAVFPGRQLIDPDGVAMLSTLGGISPHYSRRICVIDCPRDKFRTHAVIRRNTLPTPGP